MAVFSHVLLLDLLPAGAFTPQVSKALLFYFLNTYAGPHPDLTIGETSRLKHNTLRLKTRLRTKPYEAVSRKFKRHLLPLQVQINLKFPAFVHLLDFFLLVNTTSTHRLFPLNPHFRLLGVVTLYNGQLMLNPKRFFKKWKIVYLFLFNLSYFNQNPLIFSSPILRREVLALNWFFHQFDADVWSRVNHSFFFKTLIYGKKFDAMFKVFNRNKSTLALITDPEYHFRLLHYFTKYEWRTIGFIPANTDPWIVDYAIPVLSNNLIVQLFFMRFLVIINKVTTLHIYQMHASSWIYYKTLIQQKHSLR